MRREPYSSSSGFSLVEVIVVSAIVTLVFGGLFAGVRLMVELIGTSKAESGARSLAVAKLEHIRSLAYEDVGTVGGIPEGALPQFSTTTLNDIAYTERILVTYLDRPEDGFGLDDENGVTEDSKAVKVEYSWNLRGEEHTLSMVTDIIPVGIESTTGGGTLFINVFDANVEPVAGASVHVVNTTGTSTIDVTVTTNQNGIANFPGAPPLSGYEITATKNGYSTDRTYSASAENPSPNPPHVSVLTGAVSTVNFAIDALGDLLIRAVSPAITETFEDEFTDSLSLFSQSGTEVSGDTLVLSASQSLGTAYSAPIVPDILESWDHVDFSGSMPANTNYLVRIYAVSGSGTTTAFTALDDEALPGNSAGFTAGPINVDLYPRLALGVELNSSSPGTTPALDRWSITHIEAQAPISGVAFDVRGAKSIGFNGGAQVPKYAGTATTDGDGEAVLSAMEWDSYSITIDGALEGYDVAEIGGSMPYALDPGASDELVFVLVPHTANSLRVTVTNAAGTFVPGATVTLSRSGWSESIETSAYGQTFWSGLSAATYSLTVEAAGYDIYTASDIAVSGQIDYAATLVGG